MSERDMKQNKLLAGFLDIDVHITHTEYNTGKLQYKKWQTNSLILGSFKVEAH